ncbi:MAG TPA: hypothetical protein VFV50_14410 [Bdellovibrionales bacterium]|nr:hypothetical protein [Bdellovibrionales bacterium]
MSKTRIGGVAVFVMFTALIHQNCAGRDTTFATPRRTEAFDPARVSALQALSLDQKAIICNDPASYHCTQRFYKPLVQGTEGERDVCFDSGTGEVCVKTKVNMYNTDGALAACETCTEQDSLPGGRYNYEESFCFNSAIKGATGVEDRFDSSSLGTAFMAAQQACQRLLSN